LIKEAYFINYYKKIGALPHKNIKIRGGEEKEEKFQMWNFYNEKVTKEEIFDIVKDRYKQKYINEIKSNSKNCC
jgi:hypothetical protein